MVIKKKPIWESQEGTFEVECLSGYNLSTKRGRKKGLFILNSTIKNINIEWVVVAQILRMITSE